MKGLLIYLSVIISACALILALGALDQSLAVRGCCKQKHSDNNYYPNGMNLDQCISANKADNDDLYEQKGRIWWDVNC